MGIDRYAKAIIAFLGAGYVTYQTATVLASPGGEGVTANEWVGIIVSGLLVGLGVWAVPNADDETPRF